MRRKNNQPDYYYYDTTIRISELEDSPHLTPFNFPSQVQFHEEENPLHLGEKIGICIVCQLPMYELEELIKCPTCFTLAHKSDFLEWIKIKGTCPSCGASLKYIDYKIVKV